MRPFHTSKIRPWHPKDLFSPLTKGGWWDSSDLTTLFQDSAATTPVTADTDPVGYWGDKSGNGEHLIQATAGLRPLYTTDFGVKGDGTDDLLSRTLSSTITDTTIWCACVFRSESYPGTQHRRVISLRDATQDATGTGGIPLARKSVVPTLGGYRGGEKSGLAAVEGTKLVVESKFDGTNHTLTANGVDQTAVASSGDFGVVTLRIFGSGDANVYCNCSIAELIIVNRVPSAQNIRNCRDYLRVKWRVY